MHTSTSHTPRTLAAIAAALTLGACSVKESGTTDSARSGATTAAASTSAGASGAATANASCGSDAGITLPAGFCAQIFADSVGEARHILVTPDGDVYVTLQKPQSAEEKKGGDTGGPKKGGAVAAMRDVNHDGKADTVAYIPGTGDTGIGLYNNYLYVDEGTKIVRLARKAGELVPSGKEEVVVSGIPINGDHKARNFVITSDGSLLLNVGSATNACQSKNRVRHVPGQDPCEELKTRAGIWKYDANKTNQRFSPNERWATGIRNAMGLTVAPDGKVWTTQHGRDQLWDNWPEKFDSTYSAENPAEELMQVNQGDDFGWPYCYYAQDQKKLVLAPEYGGDGKQTGRCDSKKEPVAAYPGHWAPMSALFYTGSMFPDKYKNGVFIAFHGSWNRAPLPQAGYRVVFQPLNGTSTSGDYETFADGFAGGKLQPDAAAHRPDGLAQAPDGSLYISDDKGGRIYRVTYRK